MFSTVTFREKVLTLVKSRDYGVLSLKKLYFYFSKQNIEASPSMLDKRILSITTFPVGVYRIRRIEKSDGLRTSLQSLKGELSSFLSIPAPFVDSKAI